MQCKCSSKDCTNTKSFWERYITTVQDCADIGSLLKARQNWASSKSYAGRSVLLETSVEDCGRSLPEVEQGDCAGYGQAQVLAQVGVRVQTVT